MTQTTSPLPTNELACWLALWRMPGIGPSRFAKLLQVFACLTELFRISKSQLASLNLPSPTLEALQNPNWAAVERDLRWAEQPQHHIITCIDANYPPLLSEISGAPPLLFVHGNPQLLQSKQLAMVGSRNPTPTGLETARQFATHLAQAGMTITSGLALGIDAASHEGALKANNGKTIAVLGSGIDYIYPKTHKHLAERIVGQQGAIVSELATGESPQTTHFPRRNRIVSGLSIGVLIVEATMRSGSLITANLASEQGREVFAIPGSIHNPLSRGCHALLRQGAKLVETTTDILEEFNLPATPTQLADKKLLAEDYQQLLECIGFEITTINQMAERSGLAVHKVAAMILNLELKGHIIATAGGYVRMPAG